FPDITARLPNDFSQKMLQLPFLAAHTYKVRTSCFHPFLLAAHHYTRFGMASKNSESTLVSSILGLCFLHLQAKVQPDCNHCCYRIGTSDPYHNTGYRPNSYTLTTLLQGETEMRPDRIPGTIVRTIQKYQNW